MIESIKDEFFRTAVERHNIYIDKEIEKCPKPWTKDEIFQNYFFCNVFRQLDKCTQWMKENIIPLNDWRLVILFRYYSTYSLFEEIKENVPDFDLMKILRFVREKHTRGETLFSSCFIRNPRFVGGWTETYKVPFYLIDEIEAKYEHKLDKGIESFISALNVSTLEDMVSSLSRFSATKGFMAYEYACDFAYSEYFNPTDELTWSNKGPGAERGLSWLVYGNSQQKFSQEDWISYNLRLMEEMENIFKRAFRIANSTTPTYPLITMREVEHWLCEFQKYRKYSEAFNGNKKVKHRKYNGGCNGE